LSALADKWNMECDDLREDNKRLGLAAERDQYMETSLWQAKRISELMDEQAALAAQEHPALQKGTQIVRTLDARPAVPLTRQQVISMMDDAGYSNIQERANFINGIRHAELAHGIKPISECSDGEIYSRLSARDHKPDWSAA